MEVALGVVMLDGNRDGGALGWGNAMFIMKDRTRCEWRVTKTE
jgi:hypothetical protein